GEPRAVRSDGLAGNSRAATRRPLLANGERRGSRLRDRTRALASGHRGEGHWTTRLRRCAAPAHVPRGIRQGRSRLSPAPCRKRDVLAGGRRAGSAVVACLVIVTLEETSEQILLHRCFLTLRLSVKGTILRSLPTADA